MGKIPESPRDSPALAGEDLAHVDYPVEIAAKSEALASFWRTARLPTAPETLIRSPRERGYRTTSKRRVALLGEKASLFLGDRNAHRDQPSFVPSTLEPREHAEIYGFLQDRLSQTAFRIIAKHLNWLVVRGSYSERAVIFNVDSMFGPLVRKLKILGRQLATGPTPVTAAYVYVDETSSDFYLEARRPARALDFKKLFGPDSLRVAYDDLRLAFPPTSFCQVNESIVPQMLSVAEDLLQPLGNERLLDLYCGFGLFSHSLADHVGEVVGLDTAGPSIEAARANARRLGHRATRFTAARVTADTLDRLRAGDGKEVVVLDPPRDGTEHGVIEAIAARRPRRVLHVFCSVDEIPTALASWSAAGYKLGRTVPLDMFPGTPHLEVLVQLVRP